MIEKNCKEDEEKKSYENGERISQQNMDKEKYNFNLSLYNMEESKEKDKKEKYQESEIDSLYVGTERNKSQYNDKSSDLYNNSESKLSKSKEELLAKLEKGKKISPKKDNELLESERSNKNEDNFYKINIRDTTPAALLMKENAILASKDYSDFFDIDDFSVSAYTLSEKNVPQSDIDDQRVMFEEVNYAILGKLGYSKKEIKSILSGCYELEKALCSSAHIYSDEKIEELLTTFTSYDELCKEYSRYPLKAVLTGYGVTGGRIALAQPDYMTALNDYFTAEHFTQIQSYLIAHNVMDMAAYLDLESCAISIGDDVPKAAKEKKAHADLPAMNRYILIKSGLKEENVFVIDDQDTFTDLNWHSFRRGPIDAEGRHLNGQNGYFIKLK